MIKNNILFEEKFSNIYFCYSNLHAFQAIALSKDNYGICYYTNAVSEKKLTEEFNGEIYLIEDELALFHLRIYFFFKKCNSLYRRVSIYTGCINQLSSYMSFQVYTNKKIYLLDDGLATYDMQVEKKAVPTIKNIIFDKIKAFITFILSFFGFFSIRKKYTQLALFPKYLARSESYLDRLGVVGTSYVRKYVDHKPFINKGIKVASYEESQDFISGEKNTEDDKMMVFYHPRVVKRDDDIFLEEEILNYQKVYLMASSLILYLVFIEYKGEIWIDQKSCTPCLKDFVQNLEKIYFY